jgi:micrococcal nuclease
MLTMIACLSAWVIDGDSLRCAGLGQVRLLGIDAPDYRGSPPCRGHYGDHVCDDRGANAAKQSLIAAVRPHRGAVRIEPVGPDRYGRTLAIAWAGATNLNCWQISHGAARYIAAYDDGRRIARACRVTPATAR